MNLRGLSRIQDMAQVNIDDHTKETGFRVCSLNVYGDEGEHRPMHASYRSKDGTADFRFLLDGSWLQEKKTEQPPLPRLLKICKNWLDKKPTDSLFANDGVLTNRHLVIIFWYRQNQTWIGDENPPLTRREILKKWGIKPVKKFDGFEE
jgi:hypothetical protein